MKNNVSIKIYQKDWMPGLAAYAVGSVKGPHAKVALNVGAFMAMVKAKDIPKREVPYFISQCLMHEIIHVLEEWSGNEFNHRKINKLMKQYEAAYKKEKK